jgi:polyhydroxyalkanoate synthesis regulator phasin
MADLRRMTREFLLGEARAPTVASYLQSIGEVLQSLTPRTRMDERRIEIATQSLKEVRRQSRRLQERVNILEEQVKILEENKER